nr:MAG TPA_asm: hypothetical protein [Caudoviricetes sp.]
MKKNTVNIYKIKEGNILLSCILFPIMGYNEFK